MTKKIKIIVVGIILIAFVATIGISYALWQITLQQTTENVITTGCFKIEFSDVNPINLEKAYPVSDEEGKTLIPYEFTITNTCNSFASFQINLEILNTTTLENLDYLKVMLENKANILTENDVVTKTLENAKTSYKLKTGYLRENGSKTFSLRLWMDEDTPTSEEFMNKVFESKITVIATYKENLDNNIEVSAVSQNKSFSDFETFQIHATSENYDLVSISEDLETWEELETKGRDITVEKTVTTNGNHTFYFQDEAENIQDVTVVATKIDDKKTIADMSVVKENNLIKIDASSSLDNETSITKYFYSKDGINYEESAEKNFQFMNEYEYEYGIATTMLTNFEKNQIKKVYLKVEDEIGNVSDVKEYTIPSDFAYDETSDNNLRYIGANPNNYVSFNDELWRIIGVMNNIDDGTGTKETRIKLIRNDSIGEFPWDNSQAAINNGFGVNEWSQSKLKKLLNNNYYYNTSVTLSCANIGQDSSLVRNCVFNGSGLKENFKKYIGEAVWYTGANDVTISENGDHPSITAKRFYELERGSNNGKYSTAGTWSNDAVTRTTKWVGNIGLISPSDYGLAIADSDQILRSECLKIGITSGHNEQCKLPNWLNNGNHYWTINPASRIPSNVNAFIISANKFITARMLGFKANVNPSLFLKQNTSIISGSGSESSPFVLSLE